MEVGNAQAIKKCRILITQSNQW